MRSSRHIRAADAVSQLPSRKPRVPSARVLMGRRVSPLSTTTTTTPSEARSLLLLLTDLVALGAVHESEELTTSSSVSSPDRCLRHLLSHMSANTTPPTYILTDSPHLPAEWDIALTKVIPSSPTASSSSNPCMVTNMLTQFLPSALAGQIEGVNAVINTNVIAHRIPTSTTTTSSWFGIAEAARCNVSAGLVCLELARSGLHRSSIGHRASEGDACVMLAAMVGLYSSTQPSSDILSLTTMKGSSAGEGGVVLLEAIEQLYKDLATTVDPLCRYSRLQSALILVRCQMGRGGGAPTGDGLLSTTPLSQKFLLHLQNDLLSFIPQPKSNAHATPSSSSTHQLQEVLQWLGSLDGPLPLAGGGRWVDMYCRSVIYLAGMDASTDGGVSQAPRTSILRRTAHLLLTVQPWNAPRYQQGRPEVLSSLVTALSQLGRASHAAGGLEWRVAMSLLSAHSQAAKAAFVPHTANLTNGRTGLSTPCYSCHRIVKSIQRHQMDMGQEDPHRRAPGAVAWLVQEVLGGMSSRPDLREAAALGRYCQQVVALHDVSTSIQTNEDTDADLLLLAAGTVSAVTFPEAITKLMKASGAIRGRGASTSKDQCSEDDEFLRSVGSVLSPQHGGGVGAAPWSRALSALADVSQSQPLIGGNTATAITATALLAPIVLYRMLYHYRQNDFDLTRPRPVQQAAIVAVQREATAISEVSSDLMDAANGLERDALDAKLGTITAPSLPHALVPLFQLCASQASRSLTHVDPRSGRVQGYESGRKLLELAVARGDLESGKQLVAVLRSLGSTTSSVQSLSWPTRLIRHIQEATTEVVPTAAPIPAPIVPVPEVVLPATTTAAQQYHTPTHVVDNVYHHTTTAANDAPHVAESSMIEPLESLYQEAEKCLKDVQRAQIRSLNLDGDRRADRSTINRKAAHSANATWVKSMALLASSQTMLSAPNGPAPPSMVAVALQCTLHACQWAVAAAIWRHVHSSSHALGTSQNSTPPTTEPVGSFMTFETKLGLALLRQQVHQAQEDEHKCNRLMMAQSMATRHISPPFEEGFGGGEPLFTGFGNRGVVSDGSNDTDTTSTSSSTNVTSTDEESRALALVADLTMRTYIMAEAWDDAVRYFHNLVANPPTSSPTTATTTKTPSSTTRSKSGGGKGVLTVRPSAKTASALYPSRHADMTIRPGSVALEAALMACTYASSEARRLADDVRCIAGVLEDIVTIGSKLMVHVRRVFAIRSDELEAIGDEDGLGCHRDLRDGCTDGYLGGRVGGRTRSKGSRTARRGVDASPSVLLTHHNKDPATSTTPSDNDSVDISLDDDDDFFVPTAGVNVLGHRQGPK